MTGSRFLVRPTAIIFPAALAVLLVVDAAAGDDVVMTTGYVIPVLVSSLLLSRRQVIVLALAAVALAFVSGLLNGFFLEGRHLVRLSIVIGGGVVAVFIAGARERLEAEVARSTGLLRSLRRTERELTGILAGLAEAVTVHDAHGVMRYANDVAAELLGAADAGEVLATSGETLAARFRVEREDGSPVAYEEYPSLRIFQGELSPPPLLTRSTEVATGRERWLLTKAKPVLDRDGRPILAVNVIEDVTEAKRAERRARLLAEAGDVLGGSLETDALLRRVARVVVPELADWCAFDLPGPRGQVRMAAVAHVDPARLDLAMELRRRGPARLGDDSPLARVLTGQASPVRVEVDDAALVAAAEDPEHLEQLRAVGLRHVLLAALPAPGGPVGAITLVRGPDRAPFGEEDVALAEELARRVGTAVLNAELHASRVRVADTLQRALQPPVLPDVAGLDLRGVYRAAGAATDVGGDFYDVHEVPGGWLVVIGDVTGKGAAAATLTGLARAAFEAVATFTGDPAQALAHLNDLLLRRGETALCSVACVVVGQPDATGAREAWIWRAGHPAPLLVRDGEVRSVGATGPLLGAFREQTWPQTQLDLEPGDVLLLRTDGVTDVLVDGERVGEERLRATLTGLPAGAGEEAIARVRALTLADAAEGPRGDDVAAVAVAVTTQGAEPWRFEADGTPGSVREVRHRVDGRLVGRVPDEVLKDVRLLISEVASNAVRHSGSTSYAVEVALTPHAVRLAVEDQGPGFDRSSAGRGAGVPALEALREGGYGLALVERLSSSWGVERAEGRHRVWFELALDG